MASRKRKSRGVAILLNIFLGMLGIDDFYVGNTAAGAIRLIIFLIGIIVGGILSFFIIGFFILIPALLICGIWDIVAFLRYLFMGNERFQEMVARNFGG